MRVHSCYVIINALAVVLADFASEMIYFNCGSCSNGGTFNEKGLPNCMCHCPPEYIGMMCEEEAWSKVKRKRSVPTSSFGESSHRNWIRTPDGYAKHGHTPSSKDTPPADAPPPPPTSRQHRGPGNTAEEPSYDMSPHLAKILNSGLVEWRNCSPTDSLKAASFHGRQISDNKNANVPTKQTGLAVITHSVPASRKDEGSRAVTGGQGVNSSRVHEQEHSRKSSDGKHDLRSSRTNHKTQSKPRARGHSNKSRPNVSKGVGNNIQNEDNWNLSKTRRRHLKRLIKKFMIKEAKYKPKYKQGDIE